MLAPRVSKYVVPCGLALIVLLLAVLVLQVHRLQQLVIAQEQQLQALGEASERLARGGVRVASRATDGQAAPPDVKLLHPDVENFLKPDDTQFPVPGSALDGVLLRGWSSGDPKGFNALTENAAELTELIETYATLPIAERNVWTDPEKWSGALAHRVEITDDSKEFTIYLKKGVKWHPVPNVDLASKHAWLKGEHAVTAQDLVFSFDLIMNPQVEASVLRSYFAELESWKAVDPHTVVIRWKKKLYTNVEATLSMWPTPEFLYAYDEQGQRFPKETLGLRFNQHWYNNKGFVGAGPYRMTSYRPGAAIELTRNEQFIGDKPALASLIYPIYTDPNQTVLKLKAHELGFGSLTPGQYREEIQRYEGAAKKPANSPFFDGRILCNKQAVPAYRYIGWNGDRPLFADKRVRRAMTHAFDRQRIIDSVFVGLGTITTSPYLPSTPYADPEIKPIPFDLAAASKLLAEAGWTDSNGDGVLDKQLAPNDQKRTPFEFTFLVYNASPEFAALANIYKEDLLKVGVRMKIDSAEWSLMQKRMEEKSFDAFTGGWALPWETDLYQIWHSSQADTPRGSNKVGFRNKEADVIIEKLRSTFDKDERIQLLRQFHRIVDAEQPYSFFMVAQGVYCHWSDVKNVVYSKVRPVANSMPWWVARSAQ
jgi:ABC-type transport system substrate-binding protein